MDFDAHFHAFLVSTVNLKPHKLDLLDERVEKIVKAFQDDEEVGPLYKEHLPQGSWAHRTIIEPIGENDEFDADFLLHLSPVPEWENDPCEYLKQVRGAYRRNPTYKNMLIRKNRCIRIQYANSCHVDVVPCITLDDGTQVIMVFDENKFEETNPLGFTDWMRERDDLANGQLRRVIRLFKWLRDFKNTFDCPSVILTVLLGESVWTDGSDKYDDLPNALVAMLEDLDDRLSGHNEMPLIHDPSCPGTSFNHRWEEAKYQTFKRKVHDYAVWAREALDLQASDPDAAVVAWQKLFGPEFAASVVNEERASIISKRALTASGGMQTKALAVPAPDEDFIEDKATVNRRHYARIDAFVVGHIRDRSLRKARVVRPGHNLKFRLTTDVPGDYEVWWKVRNRGAAAEKVGQLRGRIFHHGSVNRNEHRESTRYSGVHYVEAYVVKNGVVVASDHHEVRII
jgi:hypothetical protein